MPQGRRQPPLRSVGTPSPPTRCLHPRTPRLHLPAPVEGCREPKLCSPRCRQTTLSCRQDVGTENLPTPPRGPLGRALWAIGVGSVGYGTRRASVGVSGGVGGVRGAPVGRRRRSRRWGGATPTLPTPHRKPRRRSGGAQNSEEIIMSDWLGRTAMGKARRQACRTHPYTYRGRG